MYLSICAVCTSCKFVPLLPSAIPANSCKPIVNLSGYRTSAGTLFRRKEKEDDKQLEVNKHVKERERLTRARQHRRPFLLTNALAISAPSEVDNSLASISRRSFHYKPLIQLCIQHSSGLFEALQKRHTVPSVITRNSEEEAPQYLFNIPEELRRLKPGSLKWLFEVWPGVSSDSKNYSSLTTIKNSLDKEADGDQDVKEMMTETQNILRAANEQQLYDLLDYLKSREIAIRRLVKLPWLLTADPKALEVSVKLTQKVLNVKQFKVAISFVNMNHTKLQEVAYLWRKEQFIDEQDKVFESRVEWMASKLSCPSEDVSDMMARFPKLMSMPLHHVRGMLETMLTEFEIMPEAIIRDPWAFNTTIKAVQKRGHYLKDNGFQLALVKPWMLRCSHRKFEKHVQRHLEQIQLLGNHKDIKGFLHEKLECPQSGNVAEEMLLKVPSIKTATAIKLNEMIEFLTSAGFTAQQIRETPRILAHSVDTISERLQEVTAITHQVDNLQVLCRTSKDYRAILRKLKREDAAKKKSKNQ